MNDKQARARADELLELKEHRASLWRQFRRARLTDVMPVLLGVWLTLWARTQACLVGPESLKAVRFAALGAS